MTRRNTFYEGIPVLFSLVLIPQLLFYWLVPVTAAARMVVYGIGTALTVAAPVTAFAAYHRYGLRRSMGVAITAGVLEAIAVAVCVALLMVDAAVRSAAFALSIVALLYLAGLTPMVRSAAGMAAHETVSGGDRDSGPSAAHRSAAERPAPPAPRRTGSRTGTPALPPRNR